MENLLETKTPVNYVGNYFKKQPDFDDFFNPAIYNDETIEKIAKEIKQQAKKMDELQGKLENEYAKKYREKYTPITKQVLGSYRPRSGDTIYFSIPSGQTITNYDPGSVIVISLDKKSGTIEIPAGYCYDMASIITKKYIYTISGNNQQMNCKLKEEFIIPFLSTIPSIGVGNHGNMPDTRESLGNLNGEEFINTLFGTSKKLPYDLNSLKYAYARNKSFETILKTAPDELMFLLMDTYFNDNLPIHKIIGVTPDIYNQSISRKIVKELWETAPYFDTELFHMTPEKWLDFITTCKDYEKDLKFYCISYGEGYYYSRVKNNRSDYVTKLLTQLCEAYARNEVFSNNYSLNKFAKYVTEETINQGYSGINAFLSDLKDYLTMCKLSGAKPTLYTSMLKMTHDITNRNHRLTVSPEDEKKFQERYTDIKSIKIGDYVVLPPRNSEVIKQEGDALNHCVASYIKRIIDGESLIMFLRKKEDESLITLEIKENTITQARGMSNRNPYEEEIEAIKAYAEKQGLEIKY